MNQETQSETFILQKKLNIAIDTLRSISKWREDAHEYDEEIEQEPREFCEDVELIEEYAHRTLEQMKEL